MILFHEVVYITGDAFYIAVICQFCGQVDGAGKGQRIASTVTFDAQAAESEKNTTVVYARINLVLEAFECNKRQYTA